MHTTSAGQGHETLVGTVVGEVLEIDPDKVRVVRADSLNSLPSNSPVGSRMAIMLGGAAFHAARKIKDKLIAIAAHDLGVPLERIVYQDGNAFDSSAPDKKRTATSTSCRRTWSRGFRRATSCRCLAAAGCPRWTAVCRCIRAIRSNST
jgi:CO/xanthine dehydrogenase Mo-binding subunit